MDGVYEIEMVTPIGKQKGSLQFILENTKLNVILYTIHEKSIYEGNISGNTFSFHGIYRRLLLKIPFTVEGKVKDGHLTALVKTAYGEYQVSGDRTTKKYY